MVHNLEPLVTLRVVGTTDINTALELALRVVPQESENRNNCARGNIEREFVLINRELLNKFGKALHKVGSVCVKGLGGLSMFDRCRIRGGGFGERRDGGWRNIKVDWEMIPRYGSESYLWKMTKNECAWNTRVKSARWTAKRGRSQQADG